MLPELFSPLPAFAESAESRPPRHLREATGLRPGLHLRRRTINPTGTCLPTRLGTAVGGCAADGAPALGAFSTDRSSLATGDGQAGEAATGFGEIVTRDDGAGDDLLIYPIGDDVAASERAPLAAHSRDV